MQQQALPLGSSLHVVHLVVVVLLLLLLLILPLVHMHVTAAAVLQLQHCCLCCIEKIVA